MKTKNLLFGLILFVSCEFAWGQSTSMGGFRDSDASNNAGFGNATDSFYGGQAGANNSAASTFHNTLIGYRSGYNNVTSDNLTGLGARTLYFNTTGTRNSAVGSNALEDNINGNDNTAVGYQALNSNTSGSANTANGSEALLNNTSGNWNTATGRYALYHNDGGNRNTATGYATLFSNESGGYNTAVGHQALHNSDASNNTAIGYRALYSNTSGSGNTAGGIRALEDNSAGIYNTAYGYQALNNNTASFNTAFGTSALSVNTTGSSNTAVGYDAGPNSNNYSNSTAIGYQATAISSNRVIIGNSAVTWIGGYAAWTNISDGRFKKEIREDIPGLDFITQLRPVSYDLDRPKINAFLGKENKNTTTQSYKRSVGFIAQEVEQLLSENEYTLIGVETPQNEKDHYSIRYADFVMPLTKAVQELNTLVTTQQQLLETQQQRIEALESLVAGTIKENPDGSVLAKTMDIKGEGFELHQNVPNPFSEVTTINAVVPEAVQQARIVIYSLTGLELESYSINQRGKVTVEISGGQFSSGMYIYALIADDRVIDTKKMILTR